MPRSKIYRAIEVVAVIASSLLFSLIFMASLPVVKTIQMLSGVSRDLVFGNLNHATVWYVTGQATVQKNEILSGAYSTTELQHFTDVRTVLSWTILLLLCISTIGFLFIRIRTKNYEEKDSKQVARYLSLAVKLILGGGVMAALLFTSFFTAVHTLLFPPGSWLFPSGSLMIQLYPEQFWFLWVAGVWCAWAGVLWIGRLIVVRRD